MERRRKKFTGRLTINRILISTTELVGWWMETQLFGKTFFFHTPRFLTSLRTQYTRCTHLYIIYARAIQFPASATAAFPASTRTTHTHIIFSAGLSMCFRAGVNENEKTTCLESATRCRRVAQRRRRRRTLPN